MFGTWFVRLRPPGWTWVSPLWVLSARLVRLVHLKLLGTRAPLRWVMLWTTWLRCVTQFVHPTLALSCLVSTGATLLF